MKKPNTIAVALVLCLVSVLMPVLSVAAAPAEFTDVSESDYFYEAVNWALSHGITEGTGENEFSPNETCTRSQVVTFLWRAAGSPEPTVSTEPFDDVSETDYFFKPVLWASEKGVTAGTSKTEFSPNETCTRAQIVTFIWRYCYAHNPKHLDSGFSDVRLNEYYSKAVSWCVEQGITSGTGHGRFSPNEDCSRAQVVTFLWRLSNIDFNNIEDLGEWPVTPCDEYLNVIAHDAHLMSGPGESFDILDTYGCNESVHVIGTTENGWSQIECGTTSGYIYSEYLGEKIYIGPQKYGYPKVYDDGQNKITVYGEWFEDAYVYAAHLEISEYDRFGSSCANGSYNNGYETASQAARRLGAVLCVNGDYSAPYLNYPVARGGKVWNDGTCWAPGVYNSHDGMFMSSWETDGTLGISGHNLTELVNEGKVTDTFTFGPPILNKGEIKVSADNNSRAQRTFMGTNGRPGDIWICVSDGRGNDGASSGLTGYQCAEFLRDKGCSFGIPLDGGGSTTMYFRGEVLNAARGGERSVVDFVYFR